MNRKRLKKPKKVHILRWIISIIVLLALSAVFYVYAGRALCYIAIQQIAELTNTKIKSDSVTFSARGSVLIKNLVISPHESEGQEATILQAETVYATFSPSSLFLLKPKLNAIDVNDFVFNAQYNLDTGNSNLAGLKMRPVDSDPTKMPYIRLKSGTLRYIKVLDGQRQVATSVPLDAVFEPDTEFSKAYNFEITTATMAGGFGNSRLTGSWKKGMVTFTGGLSSMVMPELEMSWFINVLAAELTYDENNDFSLTLRIKDLQSQRSESLEKISLLGHPFLEKSGLFTSLQRFFGRYQPRGIIDFELYASGNLGQLKDSVFSGNIQCKDVDFIRSGFPYAIENLVGGIDFTKNSITLNNLSGKHSDVEVFFNGRYWDFGPERKYDIRITSENMPLDEDLYQALSTREKNFWDSLAPSGTSEMDLQFNRTSPQSRQITLILNLKGVDAVYNKVPYPLKNLTGALSFIGDNIILTEIVSHEDERKVTLNGQIGTNDPNGSAYDLTIAVEKLPLDTQLEAVLPEQQKLLFQQYQPTGLAEGWIKVQSSAAEPYGFTADLAFSNATIQHQRLSKPITDITARAIFTPDLVVIQEFSSRYGSAYATLEGQIQSVIEDENQQFLYSILIGLEQLPLNEDYIGILPTSLHDTVSKLEPNGIVNLSADLDKKSLTEPIDYKVTVDCLSDNVNLPNFPYPLTDVTGTLAIEGDKIELREISASLESNTVDKSDHSNIEINGELSIADAKLNAANLIITAVEIPLDQQLVEVLPDNLQSLYEQLAPSGTIDLDLENLHFQYEDNKQKALDIDGSIILNNCGFNLYDEDTKLDAVLRTQGLYTNSDGLKDCQMDLEDGTLTIFGKTFTSIYSKINYDPNEKHWSTENLVADCYNGRATGKLDFRQSENGKIESLMQIALEDVDLQQFLADKANNIDTHETNTSGNLDGSLSISSNSTNDFSRIGSCRFKVKDMQVGSLSPIRNILQVLISGPSEFAFDVMLVESYINNNDLIIEKLDLSGKGIAFNGSGNMDIGSRNIDLSLTARGRRLATDDPSVLQSLTEGIGQGLVEIEVSGDFHDPVVKTKTLPVIHETLQILGTRR